MNEVVDAGPKKIIRGRCWNTDVVMWKPSYCFCNSDGIGSRVKDAIASIMIESRAQIVALGSMRGP